MTLRRLLSFLLLIVFAAGHAPAAHAQFWKKKSERKHSKKKKDAAGKKELSKKEKRKKEKEEKKKEKLSRKSKHEKKSAGPKSPVVIKKKDPGYPKTVLKPRYRIDVLSALYLEELEKATSTAQKDRITEKAAQGMAFYEGVSIAADSLKKAGYSIDIYFHDITSVAESQAELIKNKKLDSSDLIIAAVPAKDVLLFADYAMKIKVNFISAQSAADGGVKNNPYFTMLLPSLKSHCEWITGEVAKKYSGHKVALLYRTSAVPEENAYHYLTGDGASKLNCQGLLCNKLPAKDSLLPLFDTTRPNVAILSILDNMYADSLMRCLGKYFPNTHFEIYGMPSWNGIANLHKTTAYPNLGINVTYPFSFEPVAGAVQYIDNRCQNDFGHKATEMVYRGYETLYWYAGLLKKYGTIFNNNYADNAMAPMTKFDIKMQWDKEGNILYNENGHLFISTYQGGAYKTE